MLNSRDVVVLAGAVLPWFAIIVLTALILRCLHRVKHRRRHGRGWIPPRPPDNGPPTEA